MVAKVDEIQNQLTIWKVPPALVVTDSQVFKEVNAIVPESIRLTSFPFSWPVKKGIWMNW